MSDEEALTRIDRIKLAVQNLFDKTFKLPDPSDRTLSGWAEWEEHHRSHHPIRFWLLETVPDWCAVSYRRYVKDPIWWLRYRTTDRNHVLKIHSLPRGWSDRDTRMLHACFQLLVDFVELELGESRRCKWLPSFLNIIPRRRDPEGGLAHLEWEINEPDCMRGSSPTQAERAKEKKELYLWWTQARPNRIDPWDDPVIWDGVNRRGTRNTDPEDMARWNIAADKAESLESAYEAEDNEMLDRLIKIRQSLWS